MAFNPDAAIEVHLRPMPLVCAPVNLAGGLSLFGSVIHLFLFVS